MINLVIEDGIQIPPIRRRNGGGRKSSYPFAELQIGQSFLYPYGDEPQKTVQRRVQVAKTQHCKRNKDAKFTIRTTEDGVRVWRTA